MKATRESAFTPLNFHLLLVAVLAVLTLVFGTRLLLAWHTLRADSSEHIQQDQAELKGLQLRTQPLRDLPQKVTVSRDQADQFYGKRVPSNYSSVASELGAVAQKNNVRLTRVQYAQASAVRNLLELRLDASLSGDYVPMMRFINGLERDKMFFVINGLTLTGQQGGQVNLRLRLTTYLHGENVDRIAPPAIEGSAAEANAPEAQ